MATNRLPHTAGMPVPGVRIRGPTGWEVFHQPSPAARQFWYYVRAVGKATASPTFRQEHRGTDGFVLHFLRKGGLWHRVHEHTHLAHAGDACLLDLTGDVSYGTAGTKRAEFDWVLFNGKGLSSVFAELRADREPIFSKLDTARMTKLFEELRSVTERQRPACDVNMASLLLALLAELFASRQGHVSFAALPGERHYSVAVRRAIDRITAFYDQRWLSVKGIATKVHQSVPYFSSRFHREVGVSPKAYLIHYRIEQARKHLETSDKSIGQIAHSVGFGDPNYFARQFAKATGSSPREYRRTHQIRR